MSPLLTIPWFRADPWIVPLPVSLPIVGDTLEIQPFGLLVATGVLVAAKLAEVFAEKHGRHPGVVADLITHIVVMGFLLGYLLNGLFYHPETFVEVMQNPSLLLTRWMGLSSFGGFIGAALGIVLWRARRKLPVMPFADAAAFSFPVGWLFGRTGCFVVHDHPGKASDFFLAVADYRVGSPPYVPRHDLGLYEVFWCIGTIAIFVALLPRKRPVGLYVPLLILLYAPLRFALDFLRAPPEDGGDVRYLGLTPGQYAAIGMTFLGLYLLRLVLREPPPELPPHVRWPEAARSTTVVESTTG